MSRSYSDGITPTVNYKYDLVANGKGALIETSNGISTSKTTQFDQWGRATEYQQVTDGQTYTSKYKYNLSGALVEEEYPSGRKVKNDFDANGDLSRVWGINGQVQQTFANSFKYTAAGGISAMKLGNGRWETAKFNERLQVTELGLGHSATDAGVWKVNYEFGELDANGDVIAGTNTGNIARQTTSFNGLSQPFVQSYKYDALYRLTEAVETSGATTENWRQNFTYDRYGNRLTHQKYLNGNFIAQDNQTHPSIDPTTNRFTTGQGYTYDLNGNLIADAEGRQFTFNADNKQTLVMNGTVKVGEYFYDGDGKRIKKKTFHENGVLKETTIFVYSGGKLIAEYSTTPPPAQGKTKYLTEDHLGTPRIITDATGQVIARRDFMPFGEELSFGIGERSQTQKYSSDEDDVKQKFTGYQEDKETGLDFAEARMYANQHGRFTAVDPLLASGKSANPQTFNRYVYVGNNPINITDPLGLDWYYNEETKSYNWSDDGKTFYYGGGNVTKDWTKTVIPDSNFKGHIYPDKTGGYTRLDRLGPGFSEYATREEAENASMSSADSWAYFEKDMRKVLSFNIIKKDFFNDVGKISRDPLGFVESPEFNILTAGTGSSIIKGTTKGGLFLRGTLSSTDEVVKTGNALIKTYKFANKARAFEHYSKHVKGIVLKKKGKAILKEGGADMPMFKSLDDYVKGANQFFNKQGSSIFTKTDSRGNLLRFDTDTGFFGVQRPDGVIRTFFSPDDGLRYFLDAQ